MLKDIARCKSLEQAAKHCAGNWQKWENFVYFGASDVPKAEDLMLGYIVGIPDTITDEANYVTVHRTLKPYLGDLTEGAQASEYKASFCGDKDALKGFAVRVVDDEGKPTPVFKALFELTRNWSEGALNDDDFKACNRKFVRNYVFTEVGFLIDGELKEEFAKLPEEQRNEAKLADEITTILVDEEDRTIDDLNDEMIRQLVGEQRLGWESVSLRELE